MNTNAFISKNPKGFQATTILCGNFLLPPVSTVALKAKKRTVGLYSIAQTLQIAGGRLQRQGQNVCRNMEGKMPQSNQDYAANLHISAAHAHTAAAAAHHRGDDEAAEELSVKAQEYSCEAAKKTEEIAMRTPERLRA